MLLKSTMIYAPAVFLTRISSLLILVIATRLIDQVEFGLLTLVVTIGEMADIAMSNWLRIALLRLGGTRQIKRDAAVRAGYILSVATCLALVITSLASTVVVPERWSEFAFALAAYVIANALLRYALTIIQMQQRHAVYAMLEALRAGLQLVLPTSIMLLKFDTFMPVSLASSCGSAITAAVALAVMRRNLVDGPAPFTRTEFLTFGAPIMVMALAGLGLANVERIFLKFYHDAASVAVYAAAYMLARQPLDMLANAVNIAAFPEVIRRFDEDGAHEAGVFLGSVIAIILTFGLPMATLLVVLGDDLMSFLLPGDYQGQHTVVFLMIAAAAICATLTDYVFGAMVHAHKRSWLLVIGELCGSVATVGLALWLIPSLAGEGAALALAGGAAVNLIAVMIVCFRLTWIPFPVTSLWRAILCASTVGLLSSAAADFTATSHLFIRLSLSATVGAIAFLTVNAIFYPAEVYSFMKRAKSKLSGAET